MAQQINVSIKINGKEIKPFSSLTIEQTLWQHHAFTLIFNHDVIETAGVYDLVKAKDFIGKLITISFSELSGGGESTFKGILTNISLSNNLNASGDLIFKGYGTTILLETNENNASFLEEPLSNIVNKVTADAPNNMLSINCSPTSDKSKPLPFTVQYGESNFAFLRRLAGEYGQWFFYDGGTLYFGKKPNLAKVDLCFPNNVSDYDLQMSIQSVNFQEFSFLSKEAKELNSKSNSQNVDGLDALGKFALNAATNTFKIESKQLSARKFKETADLNDKLKIRKSSLAAEMVMLHLNCDNPSLKVGSKISFSTKPLQDKAAQNHGEFIITSITHSTDGIGNYENLVYAIPSSVTIPPNPFIEKPMAETQMGIVLDNNDPEKRGRVQVKLLWQENDEKTPWLRVMSLSAGAQNGDKKNRGIFFTPEVGDMVLVGFTQNDPERPFVLGSMPTGKTSDTTKNNDNQTKAIRTRTGATIYFHDKEKSKEQEIRIQTDKENYLSILVNNGNGNIKLYSTKEIEVKSKELINIKSGGTINISATKELNMKAENIKMEASDSITIKAEKNIKQKSGQDFEVEAGKDLKSKATMNVSLEGGSKTHVAGMVVDVQSQTTMEVKAQAMLSVQASGITEVKGGLVKIN